MIFLLIMVLFHSYVKQPESISLCICRMAVIIFVACLKVTCGGVKKATIPRCLRIGFSKCLKSSTKTSSCHTENLPVSSCFSFWENSFPSEICLKIGYPKSYGLLSKPYFPSANSSEMRVNYAFLASSHQYLLVFPGAIWHFRGVLCYHRALCYHDRRDWRARIRNGLNNHIDHESSIRFDGQMNKR